PVSGNQLAHRRSPFFCSVSVPEAAPRTGSGADPNVVQQVLVSEYDSGLRQVRRRPPRSTANLPSGKPPPLPLYRAALPFRSTASHRDRAASLIAAPWAPDWNSSDDHRLSPLSRHLGRSRLLPDHGLLLHHLGCGRRHPAGRP